MRSGVVRELVMMTMMMMTTMMMKVRSNSSVYIVAMSFKHLY